MSLQTGAPAKRPQPQHLPETALIAGERGGRTKISGAATKWGSALARRRSAGSYQGSWSLARQTQNAAHARRRGSLPPSRSAGISTRNLIDLRSLGAELADVGVEGRGEQQAEDRDPKRQPGRDEENTGWQS
jgi:hypothetical protein